MSYYLDLGMEILARNPLTGRFNKGTTSWNKGMTWDEMGISKRKQKKILSNLQHLGRHDIGGWNKKAVVALDDEGNKVGWFESIMQAGKKVGVTSKNINYCCKGRRKHAGGYRWKYFSEWEEKKKDENTTDN